MASTFGTVRSQVDRRWAVHEVAAACTRAAVVGVPLPLSVGVGVLVGWAITGGTPLDVVARIGAAGLASVVTFVMTEWVGRRLLPLAVLLRLSLVFPDQAPSRFAVALRSTSVRRLREWASTHQDRLDEQALAEKVLTLASALNFHDRRTRGHSERTRALAELVIDELGLSEAEANEVRWGAFLHDIGKLLVPSAILNKPGEPSPAEWEQLRQHPAEGGRLVHPLRPFIGTGVDAVASHHEFYDGTGYPNGLRGEDIPLAARIVAVVDSFEVMTAVRSYKRPMSVAAARQELVRQAGKQFDPRVVRAFVNVSLGRLHWALGLVAWAAEVPFIGIVPRAAAQVGAAVGAGSSAVSTATLASVATVSLGATLVVSPLATPAPAAASAPAAAAAYLAAPSDPAAAGAGNAESSATGSVAHGLPAAGTASTFAGATNGGGTGPGGTASGGFASSTGSESAGSGPSGAGGAVKTGTSAASTGGSGSARAPGGTRAAGTGGATGTPDATVIPGTSGSTSASGVPAVSTVLGEAGAAAGSAVGTVGGAVSSAGGGVGVVGGAVGTDVTTLGELGKLGEATTGEKTTTGETTSSTPHGKPGLRLLGL